jgi:hypothetical protein
MKLISLSVCISFLLTCFGVDATKFIEIGSKKLVLSKAEFETQMISGFPFITPSQEFEQKVSQQIKFKGKLIQIISGQFSETELFMLTKVDFDRYSKKIFTIYQAIQANDNSRLNGLIEELASAIDLFTPVKVYELDLPDPTEYAFVISGSDKRSTDKYIHEIYFEIENEIFSISFYTTKTFEALFNKSSGAEPEESPQNRHKKTIR